MKALLRLCLLALFAGMESESQTSEAELLQALDKFGNAYNRFALTWAKGKYDLAQARQLSKLWKDVETSGYWPRDEKEKR